MMMKASILKKSTNLPEQKKKKNSEEIITVWTTLKPQLTKLMTINHHQSLIKEAVEFHLHHASSLTTENSSEPLLAQQGLKKEKERLTQHLTKLTSEQEERERAGSLEQRDKEYFATQKEQISNRLLAINQALSDNSLRDNFTRQKQRMNRLWKNVRNY